MKKRRRRATAARSKISQLKAATVETKTIPKNYKPPGKPARRRKEADDFDSLRVGRYSRVRGVKAVKLHQQPETIADYGAQKGAPR